MSDSIVCTQTGLYSTSIYMIWNKKLLTSPL